MATYPVTGIYPAPKKGDPVPLRKEVDAWYFPKADEDVIQVKLFLLVLREFQQMDPEDMKG